MNIYIIKEWFRIEGLSGEVLENRFIQDFTKYEDNIELE